MDPMLLFGVHWLSPILAQQAGLVFRSEGGSRGEGTCVSQGPSGLGAPCV